MGGVTAKGKYGARNSLTLESGSQGRCRSGGIPGKGCQTQDALSLWPHAQESLHCGLTVLEKGELWFVEARA